MSHQQGWHCFQTPRNQLTIMAATLPDFLDEGLVIIQARKKIFRFLTGVFIFSFTSSLHIKIPLIKQKWYRTAICWMKNTQVNWYNLIYFSDSNQTPVGDTRAYKNTPYAVDPWSAIPMRITPSPIFSKKIVICPWISHNYSQFQICLKQGWKWP